MTTGRGTRTGVRRGVAAVAVAATALLVAGCGGGPAEPQPTVGVPVAQAPAVTPDQPTPPVQTSTAPGATGGAAATSTPGSGTTDGATDPGSDATDSGKGSDKGSDKGAGTSDGTKSDGTKSDATKSDATKRTEHADLRVGDHGARVLALQKRLQSLGYWITDADGSFGPSTLQAVWAVQKVAGLGRDGVVGAKTRAALDAGTLPTPRTRSGHVIEVDLARQILLIVDDGTVSTVLNASTGSGKPYKVLDGPAKGHTYVATTPRGTYRIGRQYDALYTSKLGLGEMWRPKFFNGGIAIHGLWYNVPAYAASHGCVRVSNPAMDWIWSTGQAPQGTTVVVY